MNIHACGYFICTLLQYLMMNQLILSNNNGKFIKNYQILVERFKCQKKVKEESFRKLIYKCRCVRKLFLCLERLKVEKNG